MPTQKRPPPPPEDFPEALPIRDVLDLHGFYPEQIDEVVTAFLDQAKSLHLDRVRIIHGKGKSRLKWEVQRVLRQRKDVMAFGDAAPDQGGWGATVVIFHKKEGALRSQKELTNE